MRDRKPSCDRGPRPPGRSDRRRYRARRNGTLSALGEVSEWPKERDWKSRTCCKVGRGFNSRPLRFSGRIALQQRDSARCAKVIECSTFELVRQSASVELGANVVLLGSCDLGCPT